MARVLVTGATGFLGSRITHQLLKSTKMSVIGTSSQVSWKGERLRRTLEDCTDLKQTSVTDRLELVECDMLLDYECFYKAVKECKPDYVIHTACPFMQDVGATKDE